MSFLLCSFCPRTFHLCLFLQPLSPLQLHISIFPIYLISSHVYYILSLFFDLLGMYFYVSSQQVNPFTSLPHNHHIRPPSALRVSAIWTFIHNTTHPLNITTSKYQQTFSSFHHSICIILLCYFPHNSATYNHPFHSAHNLPIITTILSSYDSFWSTYRDSYPTTICSTFFRTFPWNGYDPCRESSRLGGIRRY